MKKQVGLWRRRWQVSQPALLTVELNETQHALWRTIEDVLSDTPRSGSPGKFAGSAVAEIIPAACEKPKDSNRPITHWSRRQLKDEVILRGIVPSISTSLVGNLLNQAVLHPSWLNQIETIFGIINRRAIERGNFTSMAALRERLTEFINYFNETFAKPLNWTYTGRPTQTAAAEKPKTWRQLWQST